MVGLAGVATDRIGDRRDEPVDGAVTEALDELVQALDLDHHDGGHAAVALDAGVLVRQESRERHGHQQAGQGVRVGPGTRRGLDRAWHPGRPEAGGSGAGRGRGHRDRRRCGRHLAATAGGQDQRDDDEDDVRDDDADEERQKDLLRIHGPDDS